VAINVNLIPGQYQIGDLVFGRNTVYPVNSVEVQGYNVQAQDSQMIRSDEIQFGFDNFQPAPIIFEIGVLDFRAIPNMAGLVGSATFGTGATDQAVNTLAQAWRGEGVRKSWGEMMELKCCQRDGTVVVWYGRPRKFQVSKRSRKSNYMVVNAEFQRADTLCYSNTENITQILKSDNPTYITRSGAQSDTWLRIIGYGPLTRPVITIGSQQVDLDISVAAGEAFEVSSYPWSRRAIKSDGSNISAKMIGDTQYLDRLVLPANQSTAVRWTSSELNTWIPDLSNAAWSETIQDMPTSTFGQYYKMPSTFTTIAGTPVVRFDALNFGSFRFPFVTPSKYLSGPVLGGIAATLYNAKTYTSNLQHCEARIVEPFGGRSAIVIMSNSTMTNYVMLEVTSGLGNNWLKIRNGTAYNGHGTVRASWQNTNAFGWAETDTVGITSSLDSVSGKHKYTAYLNGVERASWIDTGSVVSVGASNRMQGFIFDLDNNLLKQGTGFKNIVAYDKATVLTPVGSVYVMWRNAFPGAE